MIADLAIELQGTGVHAINYHPGPVDTEASQLLSSHVITNLLKTNNHIISEQNDYICRK
jgi:NAD(P)-dependent dehydrogenase (short-subunit alcohol dehydrogenase family)